MKHKERIEFIMASLILLSLVIALIANSIAAAICFCGLIYDYNHEGYKKGGEK